MTKELREYITNENKANDKVREMGYTPLGYSMLSKKVVVKDSQGKLSHFKNWQEAVKELQARKDDIK